MAGQLLGIYLNDHYAGATAGLALFRRAAGAQAGTPAGAELQRLAGEVAEDRAALRALLDRLGVPVQRSKVLSGWVLEKAARLKPNGRAVRRSPLSSLVELEALVLGVQGKGAGFAALRAADLPGQDPAELDRLIAQAERQAEALERLRRQVAAEVLSRA